MSNAITLQPTRLSMRYSAGKLSQEDLIEPDIQEPNLSKDIEKPENPTAESNPEPATVYKEETFCDYMVNICQCTSWLCANLVSSIVLCFESCIDFVHTCKCNDFCCDVCGGSEQSLEDHHEITNNTRNNDTSPTEDDYIICFTQDIEEGLTDSCVIVEKNNMPEIDGEKTKNICNNQTQSDSEDNKTWI